MFEKKAKCDKCKHCKLITEYDVIVCDFLNNYREIQTIAFMRPKFCSNFERR